MKPFEDKAHTTMRAKMDKVSGNPKNFESSADKARRIVYKNEKKPYDNGAPALYDAGSKMQKGNKFADGGPVDPLPNPFTKPPKPIKPAKPTPLPPNEYSRGGRR